MNETTWKIIDYAWALVGGLLMIIWGMLNHRISTNHKVINDRLTEHKESVDTRFQGIDHEQDIQRGHIAKIFDKLEEHSQASVNRHIELLNALHDQNRKNH